MVLAEGLVAEVVRVEMGGDAAGLEGGAVATGVKCDAEVPSKGSLKVRECGREADGSSDLSVSYRV